MRILNITPVDNKGQRFNGLDLQEALRHLGHESTMAVRVQMQPRKFAFAIGNRFTHKLDKHILIPLERRLSLQSLLPSSGWTLQFNRVYRRAQILHLHLIQLRDFFSLFHLPIMSRRKQVVWTLHDPWALSGHCIHPFECDRWQTGCGHCPDLSIMLPLKRDRTALNWKIKRWIMRRSKITLVVASEWMRERVSRSPILQHLPCHIIPFGIDTEVFAPRDKAVSRARFGIPPDAHVLAFRHTPRTPFKGWPWLREALADLPLTQPTYLLTVDTKGELGELANKYRVMELGWTDDEQTLADVMNAADLFLMPSIAETFGLMAVEAMACGTPSVVFEGTALPSVIRAPQTGLAVPYKNAAALREAIQALLADSARRQRMGQAGIALARAEYTLSRYVDRHIALYESLLNRSKQPR